MSQVSVSINKCQYFRAERDVYRIGIIGGGPKGLYSLERLLANLEPKKFGKKIEIYIFDKTSFLGAGHIYRPDQPHYLLMNYANGNINAWSESKPKSNVKEQLSFVEWLQKHSQFSNSSANGYSSRAVVGLYLSDCFEKLKAHYQAEIDINPIVGEVLDVDYQKNESSIIFKSSNEGLNKISGFNQLLLSTGHPLPQKQEKDRFIDFIYPVNKKLSKIKPKTKIGVKGMGLTFIDAVLALTEGRGGTFIEDKNGELKYQPSGCEPDMILPFSKSGLPMIPRQATNNIQQYKPRYFHLNSIKNRVNGKYNFEKDLLPLIKQEIIFAYYELLFNKYDLELKYNSHFNEVNKQIKLFHQQYPHEQPFDLSILFSPFKDKAQISNTSLVEYLEFLITEAEKGEIESPMVRAASIWRHLSNLFNQMYSFGGLEPASQQIFDKKYAGQFNRTAYGPPIINVKKLLAIAKAGYLNFDFCESPQVLWDDAQDTFLLKSQNNKSIALDYLIDARIPKISVKHNPSPLYQNLLNRGIVRPFENHAFFKEPYEPGCIDINRNGHPINTENLLLEDVLVTGTPTEGVTYDNDTLSTSRNDFVSSWARKVNEDYKKTVFKSNYSLFKN
ncbi:FAD/NAD(P)-binding protein [Chondrinema litorale]|uniref:FAD/NAD(P)-binding protein n=1 Tax=Chondrinema litorale TaxID=2994555 RepID=UPI00254281A2|nr:FAD/NAD(P)-binding protein [Chondrinema litorale]UZR98491.1 FAD/NAD(P)-binding protein [Chondrinema litorale]